LFGKLTFLNKHLRSYKVKNCTNQKMYRCTD
jgi:hypothetical protein